MAFKMPPRWRISNQTISIRLWSTLCDKTTILQFWDWLFSLLQTVYFGTGYVWLIVVVINNWLRPQCLARLITPCLPGWSPSCSESEIRINPETEPLTRLLAVARDNLDVNVLGDGGEGDLEAADGGEVFEPPVCTSANQAAWKVSQNFKSSL